MHSRKETAKTARYIKDTAIANEAMAKFLREDSASREILQVCVGMEAGRGTWIVRNVQHVGMDRCMDCSTLPTFALRMPGWTDFNTSLPTPPSSPHLPLSHTGRLRQRPARTTTSRTCCPSDSLFTMQVWKVADRVWGKPSVGGPGVREEVTVRIYACDV